MSKVKDFFKGWSKFELCWLVLSTVIMIVLSIIWGDNTLALISGITGILGVVLAAKGKVSTYFFATINVAIYAYLTFNNHLYGEFMLNAFYYIPMNFVGFYLWSRHKDEESGEVEGKALTPKQIVILLIATAVIVIIYWQILTHLGGQLALIDAMSTVFSVIALISIFPRPAASALAEPDMPAKIRLATTFTCPSPPLIWPTRQSANSNISSVTPALFITQPTTIKNGEHITL